MCFLKVQLEVIFMPAHAKRDGGRGELSRRKEGGEEGLFFLPGLGLSFSLSSSPAPVRATGGKRWLIDGGRRKEERGEKEEVGRDRKNLFSFSRVCPAGNVGARGFGLSLPLPPRKDSEKTPSKTLYRILQPFNERFFFVKKTSVNQSFLALSRL